MGGDGYRDEVGDEKEEAEVDKEGRGDGEVEGQGKAAKKREEDGVREHKKEE